MGKIFKPSGGTVKLTKSGKSINFLFEVIRREPEWKKKIVDKMKFYQDFYNNFIPMDSGFKSLPQLILVCEDERHMAEVFREIITNNIKFDIMVMIGDDYYAFQKNNLFNNDINFSMYKFKSFRM